jgi:hypothetical protein
VHPGGLLSSIAGAAGFFLPPGEKTFSSLLPERPHPDERASGAQAVLVAQWPGAGSRSASGGPVSAADAALTGPTPVGPLLALWPGRLTWWGGCNEDAMFRQGPLRHVLVCTMR